MPQAEGLGQDQLAAEVVQQRRVPGERGAHGEPYHLVGVDQRQLHASAVSQNLTRLVDRPSSWAAGLVVNSECTGPSACPVTSMRSVSCSTVTVISMVITNWPSQSGELDAQVVPVAAAELLLVADPLYLVRLDLEGVDVRRPSGRATAVGALADRRDDPVL